LLLSPHSCPFCSCSAHPPTDISPLSLHDALPILLVFAAGIFMDRRGWIPGRSDRQPAGLRKTFAPFWEAWDRVQEHYVDRNAVRSEEHTSELQSLTNLVCRLLLEKKK